MSLLLCGMLAIGLFIYVFAPVTNFAHARQKSRAEYLRERKEAIYENLRDLNFEYKAGKFPEADYLVQRAALEDEAAAVLAQLDQIGTSGATN